nr:YggT family protein [Desulfobacterales bacterium]
MFILGNLLQAFATIINIVLTIFMWLVIARAILSWVNPDPYNPIVRFIYSITEPVLFNVRRFIPFSFGGIDISPIIVLLAIVFLQTFLVNTLRMITFRLLN